MTDEDPWRGDPYAFGCKCGSTYFEKGDPVHRGGDESCQFECLECGSTGMAIDNRHTLGPDDWEYTGCLLRRASLRDKQCRECGGNDWIEFPEKRVPRKHKIFETEYRCAECGAKGSVRNDYRISRGGGYMHFKGAIGKAT